MFEVLKRDRYNKSYSMGVVTYISRFEEYFKPLVRQLDKYFPGIEKNYVLNGFYDQERQQKYLGEALAFLKTTRAHSVTYYNEHQSLAKCWNQLIIRSSNEKLVVMNDDLRINWIYPLCLNLQAPFFKHTVINRTWSNFIISKDIIRKFGWFDERLLGVGMEDADYFLREAIGMGKVYAPAMYFHNIYCFGVKNIVAKNFDPGWKRLSSTVGNKYTQYNIDFFHQKWDSSKDLKPGSTYALDKQFYRIKPGMETPMFYNLNVLDNPLTVLPGQDTR